MVFDSIVLVTSNTVSERVIAKLGTTTLPQLDVRRDIDSVSISWSVLVDDFHLESAADLSSPEFWTSNAVPALVSGPLKTVTVPIASHFRKRTVHQLHQLHQFRHQS